MDSHRHGWANLLLRWTHVVNASAWVGASFQLVFLGGRLAPQARAVYSKGEGSQPPPLMP